MIVTSSTAGEIGLPPECEQCHEHHGLDISCEAHAEAKNTPPSLNAFQPIATFNVTPGGTWLPTQRHRMALGYPETLEQLWTSSTGQQEWRSVTVETYTATQGCEVYRNSTGELLGTYKDPDEELAMLRAAEDTSVPLDDMFTRVVCLSPINRPPPEEVRNVQN